MVFSPYLSIFLFSPPLSLPPLSPVSLIQSLAFFLSGWARRSSLQLPNNDEYIPSDIACWTVTPFHRNQIEHWEIWQLTFKSFQAVQPLLWAVQFFFLVSGGGGGGAAGGGAPSKVPNVLTNLTRYVGQVTAS